MKYKNIEVINIMNFLNDMSEKKLSQRISYAVMRNLMSFQKEYELYSKSLQKLIDNYKDHILKDKDDKPVVLEIGVPAVEKKFENDYIKELNELLAIEVEIKMFTIKADLFDYDGEKYDALTPKELLMMVNIFGEKDGGSND